MRDDRLFSPRTVKGLCAGAKPNQRQRDAAENWLALLGAGELASEQENRLKFAKIVLADMLGYPIDDLLFEKNRVEFQYRGNGDGGGAGVCFEVESAATRDIFAPQRRAKMEHCTPVKQLWDYMGSTGAGYGICTNYRRFVLLARETGTQKYYELDFEEVGRNPAKLAEFIAVFSRESIEGGKVGRARDKAACEERELAGELCGLCGRTRRMLAREFEECGASRDEAASAAQLILNRLLFVFVAEDTGLASERGLFASDVAKILLRSSPRRKSRRIWAYMHDELFAWFRSGSDDPVVAAFDGSLFGGPIDERLSFQDRREDGFFGDLGRWAGRRSWKFTEDVERAVRSRADISPVVKNLLALSSYDYEGQVRASVLGSVFDRSLADLEEAPGGKERLGSRRAPEYIARHICRRTIIPHLSRSGSAEDPAALVSEYADDLGALDARLARIKILDPACGSGALLAEAAATLLDVRRAMRRYREACGGIDRGTLDPAIDDAGIRSIVRDNVYGVDASEHCVGTARLSLLLLAASRGESLPDLSHNVVAGDIVSGRGLEEAFPEAFSGDRQGFSVIVGSLPRAEAAGAAAGGGGASGRTTDSPECRFCRRSLDSLADGGHLGFISSGGWPHAKHGLALQRMILDNAEIKSIVVPEFCAFEDGGDNGADGAGAAVAILRRGRPPAGGCAELARARSAGDFVRMRSGAVQRVEQGAIRPGNWNALFDAAVA